MLHKADDVFRKISLTIPYEKLKFSSQNLISVINSFHFLHDFVFKDHSKLFQ